MPFFILACSLAAPAAAQRIAPASDLAREAREAQAAHAPLTDFAGRVTTQAAFTGSSHVRVVPTVAFVGAAGAALAEPLVGLTLPDFYLTYLERRIDQARVLISPPSGRATRATGGG